jgi:hypothetical protein
VDLECVVQDALRNLRIHGQHAVQTGLILKNLFQIDEFVARLDQERMGHIAGADTKGLTAIFTQAIDQGPEVTVTRNDHKGVDVPPGEGNLESIQRQPDIGPVLAGADAIDLDQVDGIVHQLFPIAGEAAPVAVDLLDHDLAALGEVVHQGREFQIQKLLLGPEGNVFKVDKYGNLVTH